SVVQIPLCRRCFAALIAARSPMLIAWPQSFPSEPRSFSCPLSPQNSSPMHEAAHLFNHLVGLPSSVARPLCLRSLCCAKSGHASADNYYGEISTAHLAALEGQHAAVCSCSIAGRK